MMKNPIRSPMLSAQAAAGGGPSFATLTAHDLFNEVSNNDLNLHTMDIGSGWTMDAGGWVVHADDYLTLNAWNVTIGLATTAGAANGRIVAPFEVQNLPTPNASAGFGNLFRYLDASNYIYTWLNHETGNWYIIKREAGSNTVLATTPFTVSTYTTYLMELIFDGDEISATIDGGSLLTTTTSFLNTETRIGYRNYFTNVSYLIPRTPYFEFYT